MEETPGPKLKTYLAKGRGQEHVLFPKIINSQRRKKLLQNMNINGVWLTKKNEIKEGITIAFHNLLTDPKVWHPNLLGIHFSTLDSLEATSLEGNFSEEKVWTTLSNMNDDKGDVLEVFRNFFKKGKPIRLVGSLYKLLAKVLTNRPRKVISKVVSSA